MLDPCSSRATTGLNRRIAADFTEDSLVLADEEWNTFAEGRNVDRRDTIGMCPVGILVLMNTNLQEFRQQLSPFWVGGRLRRLELGGKGHELLYLYEKLAR